MLLIQNNALNVQEILSSWYETYKDKNYGAFSSFIGIIRDEDNISGLSFDIYEPLLNSWFSLWNEKLKKHNAFVLMAHSLGDVGVHESSFLACVVSPHRKISLKYLNDFVEDFKANAPIWKYDLKENKRIFAKQRSAKLPNAGILKEENV